MYFSSSSDQESGLPATARTTAGQCSTSTETLIHTDYKSQNRKFVHWHPVWSNLAVVCLTTMLVQPHTGVTCVFSALFRDSSPSRLHLLYVDTFHNKSPAIPVCTNIFLEPKVTKTCPIPSVWFRCYLEENVFWRKKRLELKTRKMRGCRCGS